MKMTVRACVLATVVILLGASSMFAQVFDAGAAAGSPFNSATAYNFAVNREGQVVVHKAGAKSENKRDRFDAARGQAKVKWRTDELMKLLRGRD